MARSDPRRATVVGIVGVVVGSVLIFAVLFAGNLGGDSSHTTTSNSTFNVGSAKDRADAIERDKTPLLFNDTATGSVPLVVQHTGTDPKTALQTAAAEWDQTTERLGVDSQKAFFAEYKKLPGSSADHTVEKMGMAVKLD